MTTKCTYNGSVSIELTPDTDIERAFLKTMLDGGEKGRSVTISKAEGESIAVSVPK